MHQPWRGTATATNPKLHRYVHSRPTSALVISHHLFACEMHTFCSGLYTLHIPCLVAMTNIRTCKCLAFSASCAKYVCVFAADSLGTVDAVLTSPEGYEAFKVRVPRLPLLVVRSVRRIVVVVRESRRTPAFPLRGGVSRCCASTHPLRTHDPGLESPLAMVRPTVFAGQAVGSCAGKAVMQDVPVRLQKVYLPTHDYSVLALDS